MWRALMVLGVAACGRDTTAPARAPGSAASPVGVERDRFTCGSLLSEAQASSILGGDARQIDSPMAPPEGAPAPCPYVVGPAPTAQSWSWDLDCRPGMKATFDALVEQYAAASLDNVLAHAQLSDAGRPIDPDARPLGPPPARAREVDVGARALDYLGQGLIFLDDDAPCYGRVLGPDAERRLALARHLAGALTPGTAPTLRP